MRSKKSFYNILFGILLQFVTIIYGFVVPKIIINYFGSDVNGLVVSITQFLAYISLLESGFGPVVKASLYGPIAKKDDRAIIGLLKSAEDFFRKIAIVFVIYIFVLSLIYPMLINSSFDSVFTVSLILIIGISTFAEYFFGMTYRLYLQAEQKTYIISIIQMLAYVVCIVAIVIMALFGADILVIKLVSGLLFVIRPLVQNYYVKKKYGINLKKDIQRYKIKQKWDGLAQHIAAVIHGNTDVAVLTIFCSLSEVSVYSVYYLVVKGIKSLIQIFANGVEAAFGDMIAKNEIDTLRKKFSMYEFLYFTMIAIVFSCTIVLITPFVRVFMDGVTDADYNRPLFGVLLVVSELLWAIRSPYSLLSLAAGHFKQTRKGAWVECIVNILVSVALVGWLGIIGVAVGTILAMAIRTAEFLIYTNRNILKQSMVKSIKRILLIVSEIIVVVLICSFLPLFRGNSYLDLGIGALLTFLISSAIVIGTSILFFRKELKNSITIVTDMFFKRNKTK